MTVKYSSEPTSWSVWVNIYEDEGAGYEVFVDYLHLGTVTSVLWRGKIAYLAESSDRILSQHYAKRKSAVAALKRYHRKSQAS